MGAEEIDKLYRTIEDAILEAESGDDRFNITIDDGTREYPIGKFENRLINEIVPDIQIMKDGKVSMDELRAMAQDLSTKTNISTKNLRDYMLEYNEKGRGLAISGTSIGFWHFGRPPTLYANVAKIHYARFKE